MCDSLTRLDSADPPNSDRGWYIVNRPTSARKRFEHLSQDEKDRLFARMQALMRDPNFPLGIEAYRHLKSYDIGCWQLFELKLHKPARRIYLYRNYGATKSHKPLERHVVVHIGDKATGPKANADYWTAKERFKSFLKENEDHECEK
jgi:hypothetical protein